MISWRHMLAVTAVTGLAACSELQGAPEPHLTDLRSETMITTTASLSHSFVHEKKSDRVLCSQPAPDAAFDQAEEGDLTIAIISTSDDQAGEASSSEEIELAGRTPTVLMTRELFYRACEFSHNYGLTKDEALALYNKTLEAVVQNWATEAANTTVSVGDTVSNASTTSVSETSTQSISETTSDTVTDSESESTSISQ